ncbi:MAG: sulfatase-like hydrolase/transferase [Bacteroidetes bacterium]|nr:sulfatase-like hydrolase/transferase [Bacteroidota bacterium]MXW82887.1 sulfatase-like hydrolase/transferase [Rhodothermaceae bacterium]MDE2671282.1 sulfatase-like hydrolase/transferase [Bacteroidota bacterium]MXX58682.1 sulfatase-like hydrolase/transferase [Rhodothermaceae bacterium]MYD19317.1 sulfatase-like hydrolase/transferase [Rhodothermaceae bacterium]
MRRVSLLISLFLWGAVASAQQPNIVLIVADDLGYGDLSSYGAEDLHSPALDSLAASGIRFTQFYANSPVCSPTRASLLSGRYPPLAGVPGVIRTHASNNWGNLAQDIELLPEKLRLRGYHTSMVGKWHLGLNAPQRPVDRGFDHFEGFLGDMMDDYYNHRRHGINYMRRGEEVIYPEGHATDLFTDWAVHYIKSRTVSTAPFFLYLAYNAPHTPIQPPEEWVAKVQQREGGIDEARAKLVALIEHMDHGIGKVMTALKANGFYDNTLVIFVSDNGGQLNVGARNGPLRNGKGTVYEGGIRVPAIASWPGSIAPSTTSDALLTTMDIYPTLLEAARARITQVIDGTSFLGSLLGGPDPDPTRLLFFSRREGGLRFGGKTIEAVRQGPWKLLQNSPYAPLELYNLERDPLETTDLSSAEPDVFRRLAAELRQYVQEAGNVPWQ